MKYAPFVLLALAFVPRTGQAADPDPKLVFFRDEARPILQRCVACHSGGDPTGGLTLTTREAAFKGGDKGAALIPGDAAKSLLFQRASAKEMPPKKPLTAAEIGVLRRWIDDGAVWDGVLAKEEQRAGADWWSLQPLKRPEPPTVKTKGWVRNPIDAFILAGLEARGLRPAPPADRATLLRRVTFDLTGLPPTPEEIDAFLKDESQNAYEKVVDRLLASPHYGERWARHWLDVARFSESQGFEYDRVRDHAWRYRDYVVRSFNEDKPYPQFVKEQIAGDVLGSGADGIVATGFLTAGPWDEAGAGSVSKLVKARVREEELEDMIGTVGQTFLGLTVNCARCHDHKFDPITQKDYYRLKAAFEGVRYGNRPLLTPEQMRQREEEIARINQRIGDIRARLAALERAGREAALRERPSPPAVDGLPKPMARWTFEVDATDVIGGLPGTLKGGAVVENGRLKLNGKGAYLQTAPLPRDLREKTLEAWVSPANLTQRGGGVISVERKDGGLFDAVVYGERVTGRWMAGSEFYRRTRDLDPAAETARPGELVHVAIVYGADNSLAVYRNDEPYAPPYKPTGAEATLRSYPAGDSVVLLGLRHTGAGNGYFAGEIAEARLYDKALSAAEVAASFRAGVPKVAAEQIVAALTAEQRDQHDQLARDLAKERDALQAAQPPLAWCAVPTEPPPTYVLKRGDVENLGERVAAGGLSVIQSPAPDFGLAPDAPEGERRLKLAEWIAGPENPLPARVMVNRVWHYHFGRGIVATPNDFGFNGERPTHPELLDWLASEFIAGGWSVKKLHKLLVTSATYQQSSAFDAKAAAGDADDRMLWRFAPRRLEGEAVRDAMLAVSGRLNPRAGGPSFRPFTVTVFNSAFYTLTDSDEPEYNRRTLYRINVQSAKSPLLEAFDCPDPSTKTPRRAITTTPLQALALMNNAFVLRQARCFGERVHKEAGDDPEAQVRRAYLLAFGRPPTKEETDRAVPVARDHGPETLCGVLLNASEFLYLR